MATANELPFGPAASSSPAFFAGRGTEHPCRAGRLSRDGRGLAAALRVAGVAGLLWLASAALPPRASAGESKRGSETDSTFDIEETAFRVILSQEETKEYDEVPPGRRADWKRRFWKMYDPDPTTARNERLEEHEHRIARARELFSRGRPVEWDDRYVAMVRYGEPLTRIEDGGEVHNRSGLDPPRERWLYQDKFLYMEDRNLDGRFEYGISSRASNIGRVDNLGENDEFLKENPVETPDPIFDFEDRPEVEKAFPDFSRQKLVKLLADGREAWYKTPRTYVTERTGQEIPFVFDLATFRSIAGRTEILVNYLIPFEALAHDADGVWIERRTVVLDGEERSAGTDIEAIERPSPPGNAENQWILNSASLIVAPGDYLVASRVVDLVSPGHEMGLLRTETKVPAYDSGVLAISDILFGASVEEARQGERENEGVVRMGWRIIPMPVRRFDKLNQPHVYFEVYNLKAADDGRFRYRVEYTLSRTEPRGFVASIRGIFKGKITPGVAASFDREVAGSDSESWIAIDTQDLPPDTYQLEARVTDLVSGAEVSRKESFIVAGAPG